MGFMDDIFGIIGKAVNVVMYAAGTITGIAAAGVVHFAEVAIEKYEEYREKNSSLKLEVATLDLNGVRSNVENTLS
ncbi:hypothetical protein [Desulforhopalus sp. IMCC35007]|uniref:hypothetical protein n=1 Tax=Desulforhopalus sp. IMCC35007 TaxID=2569543 RepID=UPI0010ADA707|nr:hypothetical protein [Desulforhopalus sp. IMCC35007]TKB07460.1 hypothetical protein FCL48_17110 [Desulforhopalus sp. IMCC35007]